MRWKTPGQLERSFKGIVVYIAVLLLALIAIPLTYSDNQFLQGEYDALNRAAFGKALPKIQVRWGIIPDGALGRTVEDEPGKMYIEINPRKNPSLWEVQNTLMHEMCHVKLWPYSEHEEPFQTCVLDVAKKTGRDFYDIY